MLVNAARWAVVAFDALAVTPRVAAQDPFEIHIYEYEPLSWREYSFEAHLNFNPQGTNLREGTLLPKNDQSHLTLEPTIEFTEDFAQCLKNI